MPARRQLLWLGVVLGVAVVPVLGLALMARFAPRPGHLGVHANGQLAPLPDTPNAVSSYSSDPESRVEPLRFPGASDEAWRQLREVVATHPRLRIITEKPGYLHAEATSQLFRFVDDIEFLLDETAGHIAIRSASRVGRSDLGVNRARCESLRERFQQATGVKTAQR